MSVVALGARRLIIDHVDLVGLETLIIDNAVSVMAGIAKLVRAGTFRPRGPDVTVLQDRAVQ